MNNLMLKAGAFSLAVISASVAAKVTPQEAARLGQDLTPIGAEKAANADGSIPAWSGGYSDSSVEEVRGTNPFAEDKVLFTITSDNVAEYSEHLTPGQVAMFKKYPDYKMNIYQSRRTATYPDKLWPQIKANAEQAQLVGGGNGIENYETTTIPFPIPDNGVEAIWNHITRFRGGAVTRNIAQFPVLSNGDYVPVEMKETLVFPEYLATGRGPEDDNVLFYFMQEVEAPARLTGTVLLVHETINQVKEGRRAWIYNAGQRRVRRAPNVAYDGPGTAADGLRTSDNLDMYNGAPDKYNWELKGKKEIYIPYNNYAIMNPELDYEEIIQAGHMNQDLIRYEKHRVWVVEGNLKDGERHIYSKRTMYLDEDTWTASIVDHYDGRGELWRVGESLNTQFYNVDVPWMAAEALYDLNSGRYISLGLGNEERDYIEWDIEAERDDFSTNALRRAGIR